MAYNAMRRNRFEEICRNLHFEPNLRAPNNNTDKLWKLRPILDYIKVKMLKNFHVHQNLTFDESIIEYFGRNGLRQLIKWKTIHFGYKVCSLCTETGYMLNFEVYQGKSGRANGKYEEQFGLAAPLILMMDNFPEAIRSLPFSFYFGKLFTSFPLLAHIKLRGYNATGVMHENRIPSSCPLPDTKKLKDQSRGYMQSIQMKGTDIRVVKWIDNSPVCIGSTCFGMQPISNISRYSKEAQQRINVPRPCAITEYDKHMCGVDRFNQSVATYRIGYRSKKWWSTIFTWLIDACVVNAWNLQRKYHPDVSQLEFRREIATYYCKRYGVISEQYDGFPTEIKRPDKNPLSTTFRFDQIDHLVIPIANRRRCAGEFCKSSVRTACGKCNVGLCLPCFKLYHQRE